MESRIGRLVTVDVPGYAGPVHVREDGPADAPVLVLIHGFSGSTHWWGLVVPLLADTLRVIRVDLLGHGSTGGPAVDAPVQARAVGAVLDGLGVTGVTVAGHSFGADVAVELAERSPRVDRLVIVMQAPDYSDATLPRGHGLMTAPVLGATLFGVARVLAGGVGLLNARRPGDSANREFAARALTDFRALNGAMFGVVLVQRRDRMAARPLDDQLVAAGKPTLVVLGGRDYFYGDRPAPRYRAAGATVEILAESGHSPMVDCPRELADALRAFAG